MWRVTRTLVGVVAAIVVVAWLLLSVKHVLAYPPPPDALSPTAARELVEQIAVEERVSTTDLAVALKPSIASSVHLEIDGSQFFPRILDDIRAARSSVHIAEYGVKPGQLADELVPVLESKARQGIPVRMVVDRFDGRSIAPLCHWPPADTRDADWPQQRQRENSDTLIWTGCAR